MPTQRHEEGTRPRRPPAPRRERGLRRPSRWRRLIYPLFLVPQLTAPTWPAASPCPSRTHPSAVIILVPTRERGDQTMWAGGEGKRRNNGNRLGGGREAMISRDLEESPFRIFRSAVLVSLPQNIVSGSIFGHKISSLNIRQCTVTSVRPVNIGSTVVGVATAHVCTHTRTHTHTHT